MSFSKQQLICVSGAMAMKWGKELELSLCHRTCLRVLSKTAWEQVPAVFESCLIKWEGGNCKSRKLISCISSHQKGCPAGHISTSSSGSISGVCCVGTPSLLTAAKYKEGKASLYRDEKMHEVMHVLQRPAQRLMSFHCSGLDLWLCKGAAQGPGLAPLVLWWGQALRSCYEGCSDHCSDPACIPMLR